MELTRRACLVGLAASACAGSPARARVFAPPSDDPHQWPGFGPAELPKAWGWRRRAFRSQASADRGAVVFVGDSIIARWEALGKDWPGLKVANRGIPGDMSRGVLARLDEDVGSLDPRAVVVLVGTNDLAARATPSDVARNIGLICDSLAQSAPGVPVLLCTLLPRRSNPGLFPDSIRATNALLGSVARERQGVSLVDSFAAFALPDGGPDPGEFPDGLHPSRAAYLKLAALLRPTLRQALPPG